MEAQYAPDGVSVGDEIEANGRWPQGRVIEIGTAVVITRDKLGYTRTLLRKLDPVRKPKKPKKK